MLGTIVGFVVKNAIGISAGVVGTLAVEHGTRWTYQAIKGFVVKEIAERTFATVVAPKPCLAKIDISERFKVDVRAGDKFTVKGLDIEVVKAVYPQSSYPVGFVLRSPHYSIYHAGATYSFPDMARIKCDVALLPIGGTYTMDPFAANNVCKEMRPKYVIPMHYNTCERIVQDVAEFTAELGTHTKAIVLAVGQTAKLP